MDLVSILVALATIIAGVIAGIQLWEWIRKQRQKRRRKVTLEASSFQSSEPGTGLKIINLTHPLTPVIVQQIKTVIQHPIQEIIEIKTQLDEDVSFDQQIDELIDQVGFSSEEWQSGHFLVHLPGFAPAAAAVIAELHGRMGHFPTVLRLRAVEGTTPRQFELAEIVNLQNTRDSARVTR